MGKAEIFVLGREGAPGIPDRAAMFPLSLNRRAFGDRTEVLRLSVPDSTNNAATYSLG